MSDYVIEVNDLELKSGEKYLLKDINWKVRKGEHWLVFGMNGSGKTTLLSILAGFKHKSSGTVKLFGQEFTDSCNKYCIKWEIWGSGVRYRAC